MNEIFYELDVERLYFLIGTKDYHKTFFFDLVVHDAQM